MPKKRLISYKKAAIIGGVIADSLFILSIVLILWLTQYQAQGIFYVMIPLLPALLIAPSNIYIAFVIALIIYFILGSLIGMFILWIIHKIKSNKK